MAPRSANKTIVLSNELISKGMRRITLTGETLDSFGPQSVGGYFKFLFNEDGSTDVSKAIEQGKRPIMRTYTVKSFDQDNASITVDVVRHAGDHAGLASHWAEHAAAGDTISIVGPGRSQYPSFDKDSAIFVADMTALPALSVVLENLSEQVNGHAFIEVNNDDDKQQLKHPEGVQLHWIIRQGERSLFDAVTSLAWPNNHVQVWCACEFDTMKALRNYFTREHEVAREDIYISSYWKSGVTEDGHKQIKRQDAESA